MPPSASRDFSSRAHGAFISVERGQVIGGAICDRRPAAHPVPLGRFNLDDVSALIGEKHSTKRACRDLTKLENPHSLKRQAAHVAAFDACLLSRMRTRYCCSRCCKPGRAAERTRSARSRSENESVTALRI